MSRTTGSTLKSTVTVTDMFCGAGGSSQGATSVAGVEVFQAMNHWELAIQTHNTNFPNVIHDCADVSQVRPERYHSTTVLWASPECPWHSNAQGKKRQRSAQLALFSEPCKKHGARGCPQCTDDPAGVRSRATMFDPIRFAEYHDYPVVIVENVVEARKWHLFDDWLRMWDRMGYRANIVYLNSMFAHMKPLDVPDQHLYAPQSRDRMYVVLTKKGNPTPDLDIRPLGYCHTCEMDVNALQSFKKTQAVRQLGGRWGRYQKQYIYVCPTCANEVVPYHYAAFNAIDWTLPITRIGDRDEPLKPRTMSRLLRGVEDYGRHPLFIDLAHTHGSSSRAYPAIYRAAPAQTTAQTIGLLSPFVVETLFAGDRAPLAIDGPVNTQTARQSMALASPPTFMAHFRNNMDAGGMDEASTGVSAGGVHHGVVAHPAFLSGYYSGSDINPSVDDASGAVTSTARYALMASPFWIPYANGEGPPHAVDDPFGTQHASNAFGLAAPGADIDINNWGFRMLAPHEVGALMAFGSDYVVLGNNRDQVRQYGNAVTPPAAKLLIERATATLQ